MNKQAEVVKAESLRVRSNVKAGNFSLGGALPSLVLDRPAVSGIVIGSRLNLDAILCW